MRTYNIETAKLLLELAYPSCDFQPFVIRRDYQPYVDFQPYVIRDDGVYQSDEHREASPVGEIFDWSPAYDMNGPDAPDPMTAPMLPIPFTAAELAAFMLDGAGSMIPEALECRIGDNAPNLEFLNHPRKRKVREVLQEAFALVAQAVQHIGPPNYKELASAQDLIARYNAENGKANEREKVFEHDDHTNPRISNEERRNRRDRAVTSVQESKIRAEQADKVANQNWKEWRKRMVCVLLQETMANKISGAPESAESPPFRPRTAWQIAMFDAWPAMKKLHGRDPTPAEAIKYLKQHDTSGDILPKGAATELWWKPRRGESREVAFSTVENTISKWRTEGVLPV